jgi:hypothetical protein
LQKISTKQLKRNLRQFHTSPPLIIPGAPSRFPLREKVEMSPPHGAVTFLLWEKGDILTLG